jgi:hypothetical protein
LIDALDSERGDPPHIVANFTESDLRLLRAPRHLDLPDFRLLMFRRKAQQAGSLGIGSIALRAVCAGALLAVSTGMMLAATLSPSGDTYISSQNANSNYGSAQTVNISGNTWGLLGFNLANDGSASLPAALTGSQVTKATLTVYLNSVDNGLLD